MKKDHITGKLIAITIVGVACFVASMSVLALVSERENRYEEAKREVASSWGNEQDVVGPVLKIEGILKGAQGVASVYYVLPDTARFESHIEPEQLSRGIFSSIVYNGVINISGTFSAKEMAAVLAMFSSVERAEVSIAIADTRGIEKQVVLPWQWEGEVIKDVVAFESGSALDVLNGSGLHAPIPVVSLRTGTDIPFSFTVTINGSGRLAFAPVGRESTIMITSSWDSPKFVGAFLPTERSSSELSIDGSGFSAEWRISSFGRGYPQMWKGSEIGFEQIRESASGVELYEHSDFYTKIFRSAKYAVLFIVVTFLAFFLFETLGKIRIHPVQYLLVGAALALFYLLLLSFSEQVGFFAAYLIATLMTALLVAFYSARVLGAKRRATAIFAMLTILYSYLYFVLLLEDYALLFGSLLLFVLLAATMYLTRNINWFEVGASKGE